MGELPSTLIFPDTPRRELTSSRQDAKSSLFSPVEPAENLAARLDTLMTSPTSTVSDTPRFSWSRRSTDCKTMNKSKGQKFEVEVAVMRSQGQFQLFMFCCNIVKSRMSLIFNYYLFKLFVVLHRVKIICC